jgi:peptidoglycan/xylan/chitin deacetylase (PgdA/CDA1 family)
MQTFSSGPTVVVYHHLSVDRNPLTSQLDVATDPDIFVRHMRYFAKNFDLISPTDLIEGRTPRRALLVTFDDYYRSVLDVGAPILRTLCAPAVLFLNPGTVLSDTLPLDNLLSFAIEQLGLPRLLSHLGLGAAAIASLSDLIWRHVSCLGQTQVEDMKASILRVLGTTMSDIRRSSQLFLAAPDVRSLADYRIDVGNHSMNHSFFRSLSPDELVREINGARTALQRLSDQLVTCLSIPYGSETDATASVLNIARASGHRAVFLVHGRSNRFRRIPDVFFRTSLQNTRPEWLPVRVHVLPALRTARDWLRRRSAAARLATGV